jgi:hypothetical protein
MLKSIFVGGL